MTENNLENLDKDWSNYWQGRTAENAGSALVGIENHSAIRAFWEGELKPFERAIAALDMACGAGTVAKVLSELEFSKVTGLDISSSAIEIMSNSLPNVTGVASPAESTPFDPSQFDLIVSQYGFEYGDFEKVIPEIARILKQGGQFISLSHKIDGGIHKEVSQQLAEISSIRSSGYIPAARRLFTAAMKPNSGETPEAVGKVFRPAQMQLLGLAKTNKGLAEYLYVSSQQMFNQRAKYHYKDIMDWLDGMENEVERFIGRMTSMKSAAIDDAKMDRMLASFKTAGFKMEPASPLIDSTDEALGWIIKGIKTAV